MNENNTSNFKIRLDDDEPESQFHEEMENIRIEKLGNRMTFISVLIPCLISIIIFIAYLDIKKRVTTVHDTGTTEVQNLSKELETRLSTLTSQYKKLEDSLPGIKNNIFSLQTKLNEATTAIKYIRSARKTDNKEFNNSISKIEKKSSAISNDLKNVSSGLKTIDTKFNKKLANQSKTTDKISIELNKLKSDISKLASIKIDKKALDSALKNEQKLYEQKMDQYKQKLDQYEQKMDQLKKNIEKKIISIKKDKISPKIETSKTATESKITESNGIIEQDIK